MRLPVARKARDPGAAPCFQVLIERPDNPVAYLVDVLGEWKPRMIAMLGPPASGKYTLARALAGRLALEHVSPADLVEGMIASDTVIGGEMQRYLDRGEPVPDELLEPVILARLRERDCMDKGWVMDSWPRTPQQAQRLVDENLMPQIAVVLQVEDDVIEDRVSMRLENPATGRLYHYMHDPPPLGEQVIGAVLGDTSCSRAASPRVVRPRCCSPSCAPPPPPPLPCRLPKNNLCTPPPPPAKQETVPSPHHTNSDKASSRPTPSPEPCTPVTLHPTPTPTPAQMHHPARRANRRDPPAPAAAPSTTACGHPEPRPN